MQTSYEFLLHPVAYAKAADYLQVLQGGRVQAGVYLRRKLAGVALASLSVEAFLELLVQTKRPLIFAESAVRGDGSDWTLPELSLLGDLAVAVPVTVYDNGLHQRPSVHEPPFLATLLFVPGALLRSSGPTVPADWPELVPGKSIDAEAYCKLYERRLLPLFAYANAQAAACGRAAFISIPGLGCGQFAGPFAGQLGALLGRTLARILRAHGADFPHIRAGYYDSFNECENAREQIHGISYLVRPLTKGNAKKPQLCRPEHYAETGDDFRDCDLYSVVAWDHVSWPGNDYYGGSRSTDDGVKAAATNSMTQFTGVAGHYDPILYSYEPPEGYSCWQDVVERHDLQLSLCDRLRILP